MSVSADRVSPIPPARLPRGSRLGVALESVIGAVLAATLLGYMLLGNYTRYVADDFGLAIAVRLRGYWAQQVAAYQLTDGHFVQRRCKLRSHSSTPSSFACFRAP